jgi:hypothetical protein
MTLPDTDTLLTLDEIRRIVAPALAKMSDAEVTESVAWLAEHVVTAHDVARQLIMLDAWYSVHDRLAYEQTLGGK